MNNPSSINIDPNIAYLRNRELQNHYKKINEIKSRKNKFVKPDKVNWTSQSKRRSPQLHQQFDLNQIYNINRDNKALYNKLLEISSRENHKSSHSTGKTNLKNNLLSYKKTKMNNDNPIFNEITHGQLNTDEADDIYNINDTKMPNITRVGDTVLPSIYLNNNRGFKVIQPGDTDYEPFEKLLKNTNGFGLINNEKNYNSNY